MKLPHLVIYTDRLPDGIAGAANGPLVRIRPAYRGDTGLHAHEYRHVQQWYLASAIATLTLASLALIGDFPWWHVVPLLPVCLAGHPLAYLLWPRYRLWAELEAYSVQTRHGLSVDTAALLLTNPRYRLEIRKEEALQKLYDQQDEDAL